MTMPWSSPEGFNGTLEAESGVVGDDQTRNGYGDGMASTAAIGWQTTTNGLTTTMFDP